MAAISDDDAVPVVISVDALRVGPLRGAVMVDGTDASAALEAMGDKDEEGQDDEAKERREARLFYQSALVAWSWVGAGP